MSMTDDQVRALLKKAGSGPWDVDGPVWNRTVWRSSENRVCFMAHSNGLDDDRDIATSELVAAAPDLARALLQARADAAAAVALIEVLRGVFKKRYARGHDQDCPAKTKVNRNCSCGWDDFSAALAPDAGTVELAKLRDELHLMKTAGIIEVMVRNPSVADYVQHWEGRAEKAEAALAAQAELVHTA